MPGEVGVFWRQKQLLVNICSSKLEYDPSAKGLSNISVTYIS